MSATFRLNGVEFIAPNGGPQYKFTEAISFFVRCETQDESDWPRIIVSAKKSFRASQAGSLSLAGNESRA